MGIEIKGTFVGLERFFDDRGVSFDDFIGEMHRCGIHDLALIRAFDRYEREFIGKKKYPDFSGFKDEFYQMARDLQGNHFLDLLEEYMPMIFETYKKK